MAETETPNSRAYLDATSDVLDWVDLLTRFEREQADEPSNESPNKPIINQRQDMPQC